LLADGVNNLADVGVSVALFVGLRFAQRPPDDLHPYGHGKVEHEVSRVISIVVLVTGGGIIVGALTRLDDLHPPPDRWVLVVAVFAIALKLFMYRSEVVQRIRLLAEHFPKVSGVEKVVGRKTGLFYLIDLHLEVPGEMSVTEAHQLGHDVKDWLMVELPEIGDIVVHIEPATRI